MPAPIFKPIICPSPVVPQPGFHQLDREDHALRGVDPDVLFAALGNNAGNASFPITHELNARCTVANVEGVVLLRDFGHLATHVYARKTRANTRIGRQRGAVVEAELRIDHGHAVGIGSLLHLRYDEAVFALVEHLLPEIGCLAGTEHVGTRRFGTRAPIR